MKRRGGFLTISIFYVLMLAGTLYLLTLPIHPGKLEEKTLEGELLIYLELPNQTQTVIVVKVPGNNQDVFFKGILGLNLTKGEQYVFTYRTEPFEELPSLINYRLGP